jgi:hypothetical protein
VTAGSTQLNVAAVEWGRPDRDLQIARRLDWRYLLPDPGLCKVTLIGRPEGILFEALQRFSEKLTVIPRSARRTQTTPADSDVAVVRSSEPGAVALASSALRTGGYLYWELGASRWRLSPRSCLGALRTHGFDEIKMYWCRPSFEKCLEIIPLREPSALAFALSQRFGGKRRWLLHAAGRLLASTEIPAWLMPCRSIVARKAGQQISS